MKDVPNDTNLESKLQTVRKLAETLDDLLLNREKTVLKATKQNGDLELEIKSLCESHQRINSTLELDCSIVTPGVDGVKIAAANVEVCTIFFDLPEHFASLEVICAFGLMN